MRNRPSARLRRSGATSFVHRALQAVTQGPSNFVSVYKSGRSLENSSASKHKHLKKKRIEISKLRCGQIVIII